MNFLCTFDSFFPKGLTPPGGCVIEAVGAISMSTQCEALLIGSKLSLAVAKRARELNALMSQGAGNMAGHLKDKGKGKKGKGKGK